MQNDAAISIDVKSAPETVLQAFVEWAERTPDNPAVCTNNLVWTYGELLSRVQSLAATIAQRCAAPEEVRIAFLADHSAPALLAMLGIAWLGHTWVALDRRQPLTRLQEVIEDADASLILTDKANLTTAEQLVGHDAVVLIEDEYLPQQIIPANPNIAYLLYTSGSTGKPKAVFQSHANLWQHIKNYSRSLSLSTSDRLSLIPVLSVDAALMDIFGALCSGASLHLFDLSRQEVDVLADWIDQERITIFHATPTIFRAMCTSIAPGRKLKFLRSVVLGGEAAHSADLKLFQNCCDQDCVLVNGLGPSESTLALQAFFSSTDTLPSGPLPVGTAVSGVRAWLVDGNGRKVSDIGELMLESTAVALGYWKSPVLTDAVFSSVANSEGARTYLTGDICRRLPDGRFVHCGRKDSQVKFHGQRIELADIEAAIQDVVTVRYVAAMKTHLPSGAEILVAVIVPRHSAPVDLDVLRKHLLTRLPPYMIPGRILIWNEIPLTSSGKVNRIALRNQVDPLQETKGNTDGPICAIETWLANQWQELLNCSSVSRVSSFFVLGGHSLAAIRLIARIASTYDVELTLSEIYERPRLHEVADIIKAASQNPQRTIANTQSFSPTYPIPLSAIQKDIWISQEIAPNSTFYNISHCLELRGPLDLQALKQALKQVVLRHDALRISISLQDGEPVQSLSSGDFEFIFVQLKGLPGLDTEQELEQQLRQVIDKPFDLSASGVLRACVVQISPDIHLLLLVAHHIAVDGLSLRHLFSEWRLLYQSILNGSQVALPPTKQYCDWVKWQIDWAVGDDYANQRSWWKEKLLNLSAVDINRLPAQISKSHAAGVYRFSLGTNCASNLQDYTRSAGLTTYMACLAAFSVVLSRYSGLRDIGIATPVSNRFPAAFNDVVGVFVNTIVVRIQVDESATAEEFLAQVKDAAISSLAHQNFPLSHLHADLETRSQARLGSPFSVMLAAQNLPEIDFNVSGLTSKQYQVDQGTVIADICLTIYEDTLDLRCEFEYALDLFDEAWVVRLASHFANMVSRFCREPESILSAISMLGSSELREIAYGIGNIRRDYDVDSPIHLQFARNASLFPNRVALVDGNTSLSYGYVAKRALSVAARLRSLGVKPGDLVPTICSQGTSVPISWLGVLFAGGAFVPVDPQWPHSRVEMVLEQCGAPVIVADGEFVTWKGIANYTYVRITDAELDQVEQQGFHVPLDTTPDQPIYGIFTSGTTGVPKLAVVAHRGISNRFAWMTEKFAAGGVPATVQTTPHIYDSSVWQLLWPLTCGGKAVIPSVSMVVDSQELVSLARNWGVTIIDFVPSIFDMVVQQLEEMDEGSLDPLRSLAFVILGGEQIRSNAVTRFQKLLPNVKIVNLYGPTEATIGCIFCEINDLEPPYPIGSPIPNTFTLLLDSSGRLVPPGVIGEIHLGGSCVGLGYWRDESATERSFVNNQYAHFSGGERIYKTGDLGRLRPDGLIECLGRIDDEIKVRGVRINASEIEAVLCQHTEIKGAVADLRVSEDSGPARLCAWIKPKVPADIREFCRGVLPTNMTPDVFFETSSLPTLTSGKLDRKSLPYSSPQQSIGDLHDKDRASYQADYVAPRTHEEKTLANIWSTVLKVPQVGIHNNFFDLGGYSLLAMSVANRANRLLGSKLTIADIYSAPTISELASCILKDTSKKNIVIGLNEAQLSLEIRLNASNSSSILQHTVLLTGATGFVGRFLLRQILESNSSTRVLCLVRASSNTDAIERLKAVLVRWGLSREVDLNRIDAVCGDLSKARLGLDEPSYARICDEVTTIYHCGAQVNHLESYDIAKPANVDAVQELLRIAAQGHPKTLHLVSTLSVFRELEGDRNGFVDEATPIDYEKHFYSNGYCSSKWIAERLVHLAKERGIPCNIFRLGLVTGDSVLGRFDEVNYLYRLLKSCILMGAGFVDYSQTISFTPVDYVARAMVHLAEKNHYGSEVFHLYSPDRIPISHVFGIYNHVSKTPLRILKYKEWLAEIMRLYEHGKVMPIMPLLSFPSDADDYPAKGDTSHAPKTTSRIFSSARTQFELSKVGIGLSPFDENLFITYLKGMRAMDPELQSLISLRSDDTKIIAAFNDVDEFIVDALVN